MISRESEICVEKMKMEKKSKGAERAYIEAIHSFQQFHRPSCWKTVNRALKECNKMTTKKDKLCCVNKEILIDYLGPGWEEAHLPWSIKGHVENNFLPSNSFFSSIFGAAALL